MSMCAAYAAGIGKLAVQAFEVVLHILHITAYMKMACEGQGTTRDGCLVTRRARTAPGGTLDSKRDTSASKQAQLRHPQQGTILLE